MSETEIHSPKKLICNMPHRLSTGQQHERWKVDDKTWRTIICAYVNLGNISSMMD